ncbi:MAG: hypothetical protein ACFCVE_10900 [Phycisphaerae bacterium]
MILTKHESRTFENQTVYLAGQAFVRCVFRGCTLVLKQSPYHLEGCSFDRCNWHVDWMLLWGSPESLRDVKSLVAMIEAAQADLPPQAPEGETGEAASKPASSPDSSPAASVAQEAP